MVKSRDTVQWKRKMTLETDPYIYGQMNFDTRPRQFKGRQ